MIKTRIQTDNEHAGFISNKRNGIRQKIADYNMLIKLRLLLLVLFTSLAGFVVAPREGLDFTLLLYLISGTFLIIAGANAFNEIVERDYDALMQRTANRPIPSGKMSLQEAWVSAALMSISGLYVLLVHVNLLTGLLALSAFVNYVFFYTPLKLKSTWNTFVGAYSGAVPPMMGWTAVTNQIDPIAVLLFGILFIWQFPHFLSIAEVCRNDYARAGYKMLPVVDKTGIKTSRYIFVTSLMLIFLSLISIVIMEIQSFIYLSGAVILGFMLLGYSIKLWKERSRETARQLMFSTFVYLPVLLILMMLDGVWQ